MSAFQQCRQLEAKSLTDLHLFLEETHGRYVLTDKGRLSRMFQKKFGDLIFNNAEGRMFTVELKSERKWTGNLFLEIWSNYNITTPPSDYYLSNGATPGWLMTMHADLLFYHFPYQDKLFIANLPSLQKWAFASSSRNMSEPNERNERQQLHGRAFDFRQVRQKEYEQKNLTVGAIVPVRVLENEVKPQPKLTSVKQLTMEFFQVEAA